MSNGMKMDLNEEFGSQWRVTMDEAYYHEGPVQRDKWWYYEICGKRGKIYAFSSEKLAICIDSKRIAHQVWNRNDWVIYRDGDIETVFLLPKTDIHFAARLIKASKRRRLSPEHKAKLIEAGKVGRQALQDWKNSKDSEALGEPEISPSDGDRPKHHECIKALGK